MAALPAARIRQIFSPAPRLFYGPLGMSRDLDARIRVGFPTHPKTKILLRSLGVQAGWCLMVLWLWARANKPEGDLTGMSDDLVEAAADWTGERGAFTAALRACGFLDGGPGSSTLHDWEEHQPWSSGSEARSERARLHALTRHHGRENAENMIRAEKSRKQRIEKNKSALPPACSEQCSVSVSVPVSVPKSGGESETASERPEQPELTLASPAPPDETPSAKTWAAYESAYRARYGVPPTRNAKINSMIAQVVKRVGVDAPAVAAFFLKSADVYHVRRMHPVMCLLNDCETLRAQWAKSSPTDADPKLKAREELHQRIQTAWQEIATSVRLRMDKIQCADPLAISALAEIGGLETLKKLPYGEVQEKSATFGRAMYRLAMEGVAHAR